MTEDEKEKTHIDTIIERYKDLMVEIPPADRQPGLSLLWPVPAQPAIDKGVRQAENWLTDQIGGQLWTAFAFSRGSLSTPMQKTVFRVASLARLQQRLVAARRSGWPGHGKWRRWRRSPLRQVFIAISGTAYEIVARLRLATR